MLLFRTILYEAILHKYKSHTSRTIFFRFDIICNIFSIRGLIVSVYYKVLTQSIRLLLILKFGPKFSYLRSTTIHENVSSLITIQNRV